MRFSTLILSVFIYTGLFSAGAVIAGQIAPQDPNLVAEEDAGITFKEVLDGVTDMVGNAVDDVNKWRGEQRAKAAEKKAFIRAEEIKKSCLNTDGTVDGICVDSLTAQYIEREGAVGGATAWTTASSSVSNAWHEGKDYTTQVAGKIATKVSTAVNEKVEPQIQKMRDLRDQIESTWAWIKWSIFFVIALFTVYILEPYVSLINTLLGFAGLAKRNDGIKEKLEAITERLDVVTSYQVNDISELMDGLTNIKKEISTLRGDIESGAL